MDIRCPSCGNSHRSEDHPGAFEISCSCGYSILVPDEKAFAVDTHTAPAPPMNFSDAAVAEASDDKVSMDFGQAAVEEAPSDHRTEMTPPEKLPDDMVYDPFELEGSAHAPPVPLSDEGKTTTSPSAPENSGQWIINRSQAASMGQFLGKSYKIRLQGLSREKLVEITKRCEALLTGRPWLETELRQRQILLDRIPEGTELDQVPELIAVEIYLACYELGGSCEVAAL